VIIRPMIGAWEPASIERVDVVERRRLAQLPVPGLQGDLHQDLGTSSLTVAITGSLQGDEARSAFLEELRAAYLTGDPVSFVADITESSELEEVLIVGFDLSETNVWGDEFRYRIVLREYVEPPEPPGLLDDLGGDLLGDLSALAGSLLDALDLAGLLGTVPDIADPTAPLRPALEGVRGALEGLPDLLGGLRDALEVG
jgi:hypothetical protein